MFFLILKINTCNRNIKDKLAIVAIAKNESDYIREWVAYHKVIGVERIYLYDNDSTDGTKEEIQAETRRLIAEGTKTGYMIGPDCSIHDELPLERIKWVIEAARSI